VPPDAMDEPALSSAAAASFPREVRLVPVLPRRQAPPSSPTSSAATWCSPLVPLRWVSGPKSVTFCIVPRPRVERALRLLPWRPPPLDSVASSV
jgi:hypothetical protein